MGGLFGGGKGGGGTAPKINTKLFDVRKDVNARTQEARDASQGLIRQLQAQTTGQQPSLATAQLKAAQDRNLSQLMAAAASQRGGNPALMNRQLAVQQGLAGRQLAQDSAQARLQEQQQAQQLLAQQVQNQQQQDLAQIMDPGRLRAEGERARYEADAARVNAVRNQQNNVLGSLLGTAGAVVGGLTAGSPAGAKAGSALGGAIAGRNSAYADGGMVKGPEIVEGDDEQNDVIDAKLSAGEMVIPKTVVEKGEKAISGFAKAVLAHHKKINGDSEAVAKAFKAKMNCGGMAPAKSKYADGGIVDALKQKYTEAKAAGLLGTYAGTQMDAQKKLAQKRK